MSTFKEQNTFGGTGFSFAVLGQNWRGDRCDCKGCTESAGEARAMLPTGCEASGRLPKTLVRFRFFFFSSLRPAGQQSSAATCRPRLWSSTPTACRSLSSEIQRPASPTLTRKSFSLLQTLAWPSSSARFANTSSEQKRGRERSDDVVLLCLLTLVETGLGGRSRCLCLWPTM